MPRSFPPASIAPHVLTALLALLAACSGSARNEAVPASEADSAIAAWDAEVRAQSPADNYIPGDRALGWSRHGELIYAHGEVYGGADVMIQLCGSSGIYALDTRGRIRSVISGIPWCRYSDLGQVTLAPDGRTLVVVPDLGGAGRSPARVLAYDLERGSWRTLFRETRAEILGPALLSADRRTLALMLGCSLVVGPEGEHFSPAGCTEAGEGIYLVSLTRRTNRRIAVGVPELVAWTRDGHALVVADSGGMRLLELPSGGRAGLWVRGEGSVDAHGNWATVRWPERRPDVPFTLVITQPGQAERVIFRNPETHTFPNGFGNTLEGQPSHPLWSPGGRFIVFNRGFSNGSTLWRVDRYGHGLRQLVPRRGPGQ